MSRSAGQPAYVLHQWDWSETSLILDLLTRDQGRVAVVAKGAKRPYSQLRPVLLPFQRLQVVLGRPKADEASEIHTLRAADFMGTPGAIATLPPAQLFAGFYLNELLMKLLARQDAHARLFDGYAGTLAALAQAAEGSEEAPLRAFELLLLRETGVLPELDRGTSTQAPLLPDQPYALRAEVGLMPALPAEASLPGLAWTGLEAALQAPDLAGLHRACSGSLAGLRALLRPLLHYHLGSPQLRTRATMLEVRRLLDVPSQPGKP